MNGTADATLAVDTSHLKKADTDSETSVQSPDSLASIMAASEVNGNGVANHARTSSARRNSLPLMPPFMVSAPGKVIVYGEHAVVHGKASRAPIRSMKL